MTRHIFITAGDPSADAHGARLMAAIRRHAPDVQFEGFGGPAMELEGLRSVAHLRDLAVSGFWEVAKRIGYFRALMKTCEHLLETRKPTLYLPIDYPGFNLRLAKKARQRRIPVAWYIAPQLWAWGEDRAKDLAQAVTKLLVVFPFEVDFFRKHGIEAVHVGHPLLDAVAELPPPSARHGILLMPGSRKHELHHHVPLLQRTVRILQQHGHHEITVAQARSVDDELLRPLLDEGVQIGRDSRELMRTHTAGLIKAGTSTLEAAIMGLPFTTFYKTSVISYYMARRVVKVNSVTMMNLLLQRNVVHELLQQDATPENLARDAEDMLTNTVRRNELNDASLEVRDILGGPGASERAAAVIVEMLNR